MAMESPRKRRTARPKKKSAQAPPRPRVATPPPAPIEPPPTIAAATIDFSRPIGIGCQAAVFAAGRLVVKVERGTADALGAKLDMERRFQSEIAAYHPGKFIQLYDSRFMDEEEPRPEYKLARPTRRVPEERSAALRNAATGDTAIVRLHDFIPGIFRDLPPMPPHELCAAITQITAAIRYMAIGGYAHRDLHSGNIGVRATEAKTIRIRGRDIPTYGREYPLIDLGSMIRVPPRQTRRRRRRVPPGVPTNNDASALIMIMYTHHVMTYMRKKRAGQYDYAAIGADFERNPRYAHIRENYDRRMWIAMYETLYPEEYSEHVAGQQFPIEYHIPIEDIEWYARNYNDHEAVIKHFAALSRPPGAE